MTVLANYDISGNTIDYNFDVISAPTASELTPYSGVVRVRIDISDAAYQLAPDDATVISTLDYFASIIELSTINTDIDCTYEVDYYVWSGDTRFDNISNPSEYAEYYENNYGGVINYSGHHRAILISVNNGNLAILGGNYCCVEFTLSGHWTSPSIKVDTVLHELGHTMGLKHTWDCDWQDIFPSLPKASLDNTVNSVTQCRECGYYIPYLSEYDGTIYEGHTAIMGYDDLATYQCSAPKISESLLDPSYQILSRSESSLIMTDISSTYPSINVHYYEFLNNNEITPSNLVSIEIEYEVTVNSNVKPNDVFIINIGTLSGQSENIISGTTTEGIKSHTISGIELSNIFDYNNQSDLFVEFGYTSTDFSDTGYIIVGDFVLNFNLSGGSTITNRKPKNYFTLHNGEMIQVPERFLNRALIFNSYESYVVNTYTKINKTYFEL